MLIILDAAPSRSRRWLAILAERLSAAGHEVRMRALDRPPLPAAIGLIDRFERITGRLSRLTLADDVAWSTIAAPTVEGGPARAASTDTLVLDLAPDAGSDQAATPAVTHRLTFDGIGDEAALYHALLSHSPPRIALVHVASGREVAAGTPSLEAAGTLAEGLEAAYARIITMIEAVAAGSRPAEGLAAAASPGSPPAPFGTAAATRHILEAVKSMAVRRLYAFCCHIPHWRIGYRMNTGPGVWETGHLGGTPWRVLPDPGDRFYADPFPFVHEGRRCIFFEDFPHALGRGLISVVELAADGRPGTPRPVLETPWHLSYPSIFADQGEIWMIPESYSNRTVDLYRAERFPDRWVKQATLISGPEISDATLVRHGGLYYLLGAAREGWGAWSDTLSIYVAETLLGPWRPHPANPILIDGATARPAGHVVERDGRLWRPVQDCSTSYGAALGLVEITRLDPTGYAQQLHTRLTPGPAWPGRRLHTLNRCGDIECIDGSALAPKNAWLARRLEPWTLRTSSPA